MSADKTTDAIKLNLRLPKALHRRLVQQAKHHNVSLNTEIVNQLQGHEATLMKQTAETIQPMINSTSGAAVIAAETVVRVLKPEVVEQFKREMAKAGLANLDPKIRDDDEGEHKKK